jgi:hypothetical protein
LCGNFPILEGTGCTRRTQAMNFSTPKIFFFFFFCLGGVDFHPSYAVHGANCSNSTVRHCVRGLHAQFDIVSGNSKLAIATLKLAIDQNGKGKCRPRCPSRGQNRPRKASRPHEAAGAAQCRSPPRPTVCRGAHDGGQHRHRQAEEPRMASPAVRTGAWSRLCLNLRRHC